MTIDLPLPRRPLMVGLSDAMTSVTKVHVSRQVREYFARNPGGHFTLATCLMRRTTPSGNVMGTCWCR